MLSEDASQQRRTPARNQQHSQARRREKGLMSCAECHRLKMKCDRQIPCSPCISKGCADICPNGIRPAARSPHAILSVTERLQKKIITLMQRIRQLEEALGGLHSKFSHEPHPLLAKRIQPEDGDPGEDELSQDLDETAGDLSSLTIDTQAGLERYYGDSGVTESWLLRRKDEQAPEQAHVQLDRRIVELKELFPFLPGGAWHHGNPVDQIVQRLPSLERAHALCETFFNLKKVFYGPRIVFKREVYHDMMEPIYNYRRQLIENDDELCLPAWSPHLLAAMLTVFTLGAAMDDQMDDPSRDSEAETYFQMSRASFALKDVYDNPGVATVQSLILSASYHLMAPNKEAYTIDSAWLLLKQACDVAYSIGLHRDPEKWKHNPVETQRRRALFWELFTGDCYFSFATGRPPTFRRAYIDVQYPKENREIMDDEEEVDPGWSVPRYRFAHEVSIRAVEAIAQATQPSYDAVSKIDQLIRAYPIPPESASGKKHPDPSALRMNIMNVYLRGQRALVSGYLHRPYFIKAIVDRPEDPQKSKYATSFLASMQAAFELASITKHKIEYFPNISQLPGQWMESFALGLSSTMFLSTVVLRAPSSPLAAPSLNELRTLVKVLPKYANNARLAHSGMALLERLLEKSNQVYLMHHNGANPPANANMEAVWEIFRGHPYLEPVMKSEHSGTPTASPSGSVGHHSSPTPSSPFVSPPPSAHMPHSHTFSAAQSAHAHSGGVPAMAVPSPDYTMDNHGSIHRPLSARQAPPPPPPSQIHPMLEHQVPQPSSTPLSAYAFQQQQAAWGSHELGTPSPPTTAGLSAPPLLQQQQQQRQPQPHMGYALSSSSYNSLSHAIVPPYANSIGGGNNLGGGGANTGIVDNQWMSFMQDTGVWEDVSSGYHPGLHHQGTGYHHSHHP